VYNNQLKSSKNIFDIIKESEIKVLEGDLIGEWVPWAALWKGRSAKAKNVYQEINDSDSEIIVRQKNAINEIHESFVDAVTDYIDMFKDMDGWYSFIKTWDITKDPWFIANNLDFLKYNLEQPEEMANEPLAMNYHIDYNSQDADSPFEKLAITVTMYVNDDYEGGEISIYDPVDKKLYCYKPKAGDITVFPSGMDYFHGVLPFNGGDRYLIRTFMEYKPEGTDFWFDNVKKYGHEKWIGMEKERLSQGRLNGVNLRNIVAPGKQPVNLRLQTIYLEEEPIYIDGSKNV